MKKVRLLAASAATLSLLLGAVAALAQDPIKVDPDNNKLLFENDRVRVYEVKSPPGNTLAMHSHPAHVVYFMGPGKAKFTTADGKVTEAEVKAGEALWSDPVTHSVENIGNTPLRGVVVELKDAAK
ncbi:MAG: cupin domain-containing protein [Steroidobacteraceae bacterium]